MQSSLAANFIKQNELKQLNAYSTKSLDFGSVPPILKDADEYDTSVSQKVEQLKNTATTLGT